MEEERAQFFRAEIGRFAAKVAEMDDAESREDSVRIMQLLGDNLTLWTVTYPAEDGDEGRSFRVSTNQAVGDEDGPEHSILDDEKRYNDSSSFTIMRCLRDNLMLWTSSYCDDEEEEEEGDE